MTIKQQGGIFGRNPTFNDVDVEGTLTVDGLPITGGNGTMAAQDANAVAITGGTIEGTVIGGTTAAAVTGTTLTATGAFTSLGIDDNATSTAITIDASENVGVGTASPNVRAEISGTDAAISLRVNTANAGVSASNYSQIQLSDNDAVRSYWRNIRDGTGATHFAYSDHLAFLSDGGGTERMRIDNSGHAIIPAGVTLGTTTGVYSAANTLDDYEEGTFTPTVFGATTAGTTVYNSQSGHYTKIGNTVTAHISIGVTSATGTGAIRIGGLPFVQNANVSGTFPVATNNVNWTGGTYLAGIFFETTTNLRIFGIVDNGGWVEQNIANATCCVWHDCWGCT